MMIPVHEIAQSLGTLDSRTVLGNSCRQGLRRYLLNSGINAVRRLAFSRRAAVAAAPETTPSAKREQVHGGAVLRSGKRITLRLVGGRDLERE
ncbi:MAG: hypothetical protein AAF220_03210 [Pseudomonadota bacterium]